MGWVHYIGRAPSRQRLLAGDVPFWIANSDRGSYIAQVILSCPPWQDRKQLMALHKQAQDLTVATGIPHVLDHIVPLKHPRVCGLSVPWNLCIVTHAVNQAKSNKWCPEQQELFDGC